MDGMILALRGNLALAGAIGFLALALLSLALGMALRAARQQRNRRVVDRALAAREGRRAEQVASVPDSAGRIEAVKAMAESIGDRLERGRLGDSLLAEEDRKLIDMCGYTNIGRVRAVFVLARTVLSLGLPVAAWILVGGRAFLLNEGLTKAAAVFVGLALGWMLPKWMLLRRAGARRRAAVAELPLLIDLLRLLQGVGLSTDQSLHIIVTEFQRVLPVIGYELRVANEQYSRGRTREQSLGRLMNAFDNDDLNAICRLIVQVDRHGGAVQEPLTRFGERVRERRKLDLREKVARITVKMTGVMVITLLPALLIVTGGAGLLAVMRGLARAGGG
ncbi:type II secretion system F family protein [Bordetella sp. N]|uniref:type II secretion system F family protein n=1 Tax=Bordetella sp. N TaxID=1746199 RepID=UPI0007112361|nr:type II secretion system F family protein [Bordetella sp. N]ALM83996.1 type II secretion protein F [Bordetella sp. N]